jgi:hypothetical protein
MKLPLDNQRGGEASVAVCVRVQFHGGMCPIWRRANSATLTLSQKDPTAFWLASPSWNGKAYNDKTFNQSILKDEGDLNKHGESFSATRMRWIQLAKRSLSLNPKTSWFLTGLNHFVGVWIEFERTARLGATDYRQIPGGWTTNDRAATPHQAYWAKSDRISPSIK